MEETIVKEWLCSLRLGQYSESFIDNGYDDLEICKQIDAPDLDAIGVVDPLHRAKLQQAVQVLRVEGAASVYFTVEEAQASRLETPSRNSDPGPYSSDSIKKHENGQSSAASTPGEGTHCFSNLSGIDDAYEAGRAELVRLPQIQLRNMLKDNLFKDKVNLAIPPYTTKDGERGVLEGLASRYADKLTTHYQDVLDHLDQLRTQEWNQIAMTIKANSLVTSNGHIHSLDQHSPHSSSSSSLDHNDDHPIYLPGKYNPSSCLSDAEEDQIYGFTRYNKPSSSASGPRVCLNPRSQCIYEYPPVRVPGRSHNGMKKRLGIGRLLKTLKRDLRRSADSKCKSYLPQTLNISHQAHFKDTSPDLSSTPLVVLPGYSSPTSSHCSQSSKSHSSGQSFVVASASAPGTPGSSGPIRDSGLQQAIEKLKEQEILRRREEQFREHEQVMHNLHQGLEQTKNLQNLQASTYAPLSSCYESSYMFDEEAENNVRLKEQKALMAGGPLFQHWYDEPPYESDPEDFLIGKEGSSRDHSPHHLRLSRDEDVISLKTAGDISVPRELLSHGCWPSPRSQNGRSSCSTTTTHTITQSTSTKNSLSHANGHKTKSNSHTVQPSSDSLQYRLHPATNTNSLNLSYMNKPIEKSLDRTLNIKSVSSRISNLSLDNCSTESVNYYSSKHMRRSSASEGANSGSPSDYEEEKRDSASLVGRMRVLHRDMQKKILRLKAAREGTISEASALPPQQIANPRLEFPSSVYNCYQRQSSLPVKLKQESRTLQHTGGLHGMERVALPIIGKARALVDFTPSPYDKDALKFKKGDAIDILSKNPSGIWKGHLHGKIGHFKFILVEEEPEDRVPPHPGLDTYWHSQQVPRLYSSWGQRPLSLQSLLANFHLSHLAQVFLLNGYETLEDFREIRPEDLDHMGITDKESRAKIVAAVGLILDSEEALGVWSEPSFVRHTNGRITLPAAAASSSSIVSSLPYYQASFVSPALSPYSEEHVTHPHCQIYENAPYLGVLDENNLDSRHSPSSVDSVSYHPRPAYNIPMTRSPAGDALSTGGSSSALSPSSSSASPTLSTLGLVTHMAVALPPRNQQEGRPSMSPAFAASSGISSTLTEPQKDSYHAQVARVGFTTTSPSEPLPHLKSTTC